MKSIKALLGVLLIITVSACVTMHPDLIAEGDVQVKLIKSAHINFSKVDVHKHSGETQIEVVVRPIERVRIFSAGSINILVTKPDGTEQMLATDKAHVDRHRIGSALQHAHFIVNLPRVLSSGTLLTISYDPPK